MLFDDINGLTIEIGNQSSNIGYIGEELPLMTGDSFYFKSSDELLTFENILLSNQKEGRLMPLLEDDRISNTDDYYDFVK